MMVRVADLMTRVGRALSTRRARGLAPFHPETRRAARMLPQGGLPPVMLPAIRRLTALMPSRSDEAVDVRISATASVRLHLPRGVTRPAAALLWIHGGGLVLGAPRQDDLICRRFADRLGILVGAVGYRLAPRHRYPAALDDCYDALLWLADQPGIDPARVAVGGASAGGGLAAAVALRARDEARMMPAAQLLLYPMLDDRTACRSELDGVPTRMWNNRANRFGWSSYLGQPPGGENVPAYAAPARADDLSGLPPAWIGVGTADLFHDEDVEYARRLRAAGVACTLEVVDGGFHAFDVMCAKAPISAAFCASQLETLRAALG
jgi:acetyl esterase/lipase